MTIVLGLTGSIGMGKSTVATMIRKAGIPLFDADATVHALQGPGGRLIEAIEALHPGTTNAGGVDRAALGRIVLGDKAALHRLERLIHPAVEQEKRKFLRRHRARPIVVLDIPLLLEKGGWRRVDAVAVVSAAAWQQSRRVLSRAGMTAARLARIRALQMGDPEKRQRADFVIPTGGTYDATRTAVRRILSCLAATAGR